MRVLTFMSLGETKSEVNFDDLCKELNFGLDDVEAFVIEGTNTCTVIYVVHNMYGLLTKCEVKMAGY